jgi:hypothetical protein
MHPSAAKGIFSGSRSGRTVSICFRVIFWRNWLRGLDLLKNVQVDVEAISLEQAIDFTPKRT